MFEVRFGLESKNFDLYFAAEAEGMSGVQKANLPKGVMAKYWKADGTFNRRATWRMNIFTKMSLLWKCLNKTIFLVVMDEENGMSPEDFVEYSKAIRKKDMKVKRAEGWTAEAHFVLGNKELCNTFDYLNHLSHSPAYDYLMKTKVGIKSKQAKHQKEVEYLVRFLWFYEQNKNRFTEEYKVSMPEVYVLFHLYDGVDKDCGALHNRTMRLMQSSRTKIKAAISSLQQKQMITRLGERRGATMRITALGKDIINQILYKYALNC